MGRVGRAVVGREITSGEAIQRIFSVGAPLSEREVRVDPEAYELLARSRYALSQYISTVFPEYLTQAKENIDRALEIDPE